MNIKFMKCKIGMKILHILIKMKKEKGNEVKEQKVSVIKDDIRKIPDLLVQLMTASM